MVILQTTVVMACIFTLFFSKKVQSCINHLQISRNVVYIIILQSNYLKYVQNPFQGSTI